MSRSIPVLAALMLAAAVMLPTGIAAQQSEHTRHHGQETTNSRDDPLNTAKEMLKLTPEQEQLWGRVDEALRRLRDQVRERRTGERDTGDAMDRLRRRAEFATQRAEALRQLADAVQPLWGMLSEEQKDDLFDLARSVMRPGHRLARRGRDDDRWDDHGGYGHGRMHRHGDHHRWHHHGWHHEHYGRRMGRHDDDRDRRRYGRGWDDDFEDRGWRRDWYGDRRYNGRRDDDEGMRRDRRDDRRRWSDRWDERRSGENPRDRSREEGYGMRRDRFDDHGYEDSEGSTRYDRRRDRYDDEEDRI